VINNYLSHFDCYIYKYNFDTYIKVVYLKLKLINYSLKIFQINVHQRLGTHNIIILVITYLLIFGWFVQITHIIYFNIMKFILYKYYEYLYMFINYNLHNFH